MKNNFILSAILITISFTSTHQIHFFPEDNDMNLEQRKKPRISPPLDYYKIWDNECACWIHFFPEDEEPQSILHQKPEPFKSTLITPLAYFIKNKETLKKSPENCKQFLHIVLHPDKNKDIDDIQEVMRKKLWNYFVTPLQNKEKRYTLQEQAQKEFGREHPLNVLENFLRMRECEQDKS